MIQVYQPSLPLNRIICGDNCEVMRTLPSESIDLVVTSPPYDDLRTYGGHAWDFYGVSWNLKRLLKQGGVIVWVVGDGTIDGGESGSSWRQAHHFQSIGSGTTAKMAKHNGRRYIGIEVNPEYVEIAEKRLMQQVLF